VATKSNCWQTMKCGREPSGRRVAELGVCPAAKSNANSANGGTFAGRICWTVAGTLCGDRVQGTFAQKAANCVACKFYVSVKQEEGNDFKVLPLHH